MNRAPHPTPGVAVRSRRDFLTTSALALGAAGVLPQLACSRPPAFTGALVGGNAALGHALRDGKFPPISETTAAGIVIVGGGIGGLAAARHLHRNGCQDFVLLELETQPGGNAISGANEISAYPWGAHYVPLAGSDAAEVTQLFEELGVIQGRDAAGLPIYNEEFLCADPMERLFIHGRWQEGLVPQLGVTDTDRRTLEAFLAEMHRLQNVRGRDGRRAFTIPLDASSRDEEFTRLDQITMADYLREKGWLHCEPLRWYVNYSCRDDYGAGVEKISAWAGIHYFASRDGRAANAPGYAVVTFPEGNGWFVQQLAADLTTNLRRACAVWNVEIESDRVLVDYYDATRQKSFRLNARGLVWAAPHFIAQRVLRPWRSKPGGGVTYSPWLVANLTLNQLPTGHGMDLSWDNVFYHSASLGYVVATHQGLHPMPKQTVITYYQPLDDGDPATARQTALARSYDAWCELILADLSQAHPDIRHQVKHLDIWLWGHAMVRPVPGFIWGTKQASLQPPLGNIVFAHSDVSGIAIFEEAYTRGVRAAKTLLRQLQPTNPTV